MATPKIKIAKAFYYALEDAYKACLDAGYTLEEDRNLIKCMMRTNLFSYSYAISDSLLDGFLDGLYEPFKDR